MTKKADLVYHHTKIKILWNLGSPILYFPSVQWKDSLPLFLIKKKLSLVQTILLKFDKYIIDLVIKSFQKFYISIH